MAAKLGFEIVKQAMLKLLMKKGDDGIVLTLPKNEILDLNTRITMDRLIRNNIDPNSLTSPDQVINVLDNINNANKPRVIPGTSAEGKAITEKLFGKKGEVVDMTGKKIDTSQGIMGGKSVKELMESGQVQKGTDNIKISEKITDREMFKNSNLNKKDSVTETVSYIKTLEPMDAIKEANSVIGRKGKYKNLTPDQSKKILQDTEDHIFERDIPDEDFAKGGRAGYSLGSMVSQARQDSDGIEARLEQLGGDVTSAEQMLQQINERLESAGSSVPEGGGDPNSNAGIFNPNGTLANIANYTPQLPAGGLGTLANMSNANFNTSNVNLNPGLASSVQTPDQQFGKNPFKDPVTGGGQPFFMGNMFPSSANPLTEKLPATLETADSNNLLPGTTVPTGGTFNGMPLGPGKIDNQGQDPFPFRDPVTGGGQPFYGGLGADNQLNVTEPQTLQSASSQQNLQKALPGLFAKGGRAGFYTGGITDVEPSLDDIGHGADAMMSRTRLMSPGSQTTTSTGLNYLLAEDNDNMRIPFAKGKIAKEVLDKGRRGFMKAAGATGAGIAALKTGLLGFGEKAAPVVEKTAEAVSNTAGQVPAYFLNLVQKIKNLGEDAPRLATQDRQKVTTYKDYTLTEDVTTGQQEIQRMKVTDDGSESYYGNPLVEETYMSYKPGKGQMDEGTKGIPPDEYEEGTAYIRSDKGNAGEVVDESFTISDEVIEEGTKFEDNLSDFEKIKKAEGGRIGFSKGKLATNAVKFLEKIFGKENMAEMPNRDPEMYQGMLEVVDMFRNRDKEGLKKYLQRFLPHMDDAQVEDLIVGDAEDMAGLGKFGLGNLQGQLIRLGSGRDYASKIEAVKRLERNKSLKDLEVTEDMQRKPNASGGLAKMLGE